MAENATGAAPPQTNGAVHQQLVVNAQYIKDLSFENPRAPHSLLQQKEPPEVQLSVDVKAQGLGQNVYEVLLTVSARAVAGGAAGLGPDQHLGGGLGMAGRHSGGGEDGGQEVA